MAISIRLGNGGGRRSERRRKASRGNPKEAGYVACGVALFLFGWAAITASSWHISSDETPVEGTIVERVRSGDSRLPVFEFTHPDTGQIERVRASSTGVFQADGIGDTADVVVDSDGDASVRGSLPSSIMLLGVAFIFGRVGLHVLRTEQRSEDPKPLRTANIQDEVREYESPHDRIHETPTPQDEIRW